MFAKMSAPSGEKLNAVCVACLDVLKWCEVCSAEPSSWYGGFGEGSFVLHELRELRMQQLV